MGPHLQQAPTALRDESIRCEIYPRAARFDKTINKYISETYFVPTEPDNYVFEVTVKSEDGQESTKRFVQPVLPATPLPIADPGKNQKLRVGQKVVVSGQDSKAFNDRIITKYEWTKKEAPGDFDLTGEQRASRQFDFVPRAPGKYVFELKVFDGKRWGDPASVEVVATSPLPLNLELAEPIHVELEPHVRIAPPSVRPKAVASVSDNNGKPFRVGDTIVLDGSKSVANESDPPNFIWKQLDEDKSPRVRALTSDLNRPFSDKRSDKLNYPVQSFIALENGAYKFVLQMVTKDGVIESDPVTFQVGAGGVDVANAANNDPGVRGAGPLPPVARLTANKTEVSVGEEVTLDGSKSSCEGGAKLAYIWSPVPGRKFPDNIRGIDGPVARFSAEREGEYSVMLIVDDGRQKAQSDPVTIKVSAADKPPVIDLEPAQKCSVGEVVAMDAKIVDPQKYPLTIRWTCLEPKALKIPPEYSSEARFRFKPREPGTYIFQVEATNSKGLSTVAQTQIGVKDIAPLKPTAIISGPERATQGDKITLSGANSSSPSKKSLTYRWAEESEGGPKIKDLVPSSKKPEWTFKVAEPGRHVVSLVVNDGQLDSDPIRFNIDVVAAATPPPKAKPVAKISGPKSVPVKTGVALSAENSSGDGPLQYYWNQQVDGAPDLGLSANQRRGNTLSFVPMKPGVYTLTLDVMDATNQRSETETFALEVKGAPATPPAAVATLLTRDPSQTGKEVRLSAEKSSDPGGAPLTYKWKQAKGPQTLVIAPRDTAQEIVVTPLRPGPYELQVIVNNGELDSVPAPVAFTVNAGALPKAEIAEITPPIVGDTVMLDGSRSNSPNGVTGELLQYRWKQIKGEPLRLLAGEDRKSKIQFTIPAEDVYVWELAVNDGNDWSEPAQITFQSRARTKNAPPVAVVEKQIIATEVGMQTIIDASASNDPDKGPKPLTFRWRKGGREFDNDGPILKIMPQTPGTQTFEVQAFDGKDYSEPVQVTVNVLPAGALPVAVPTVTDINGAPITPAVAKAADPVKDKDNRDKVIVLDGTKSQPDKKNLIYTWKQIAGTNLKLSPSVLAKDRVGFRIYKAGNYKFELVVSDGENSSLPATIDLKVIEDDAGGDKIKE